MINKYVNGLHRQENQKTKTDGGTYIPQLFSPNIIIF